MVQEKILQRLMLFGLFLLMCAARCQAQTDTFQNGEIWEQIMTNPPILVKITYVDGIEKRTEYPQEVRNLRGEKEGIVTFDIAPAGGPLYIKPDTTPPTSVITAVHDGDSY